MKTTLLYEQSKLLTTLNRQDEAERLLAKCLDDINEFISSRELIYLALRIINNYGYLLSKREDYEAARKILESGKTVYEAKKDEGFCSSDDLFSPNLSTSFSSKLEHLATNNLQMLAFVYSKLELHDKFAEYHHQVLDRQLEINDDPLESIFREAKNHLEVAEFVLKKYENELKALESSIEITEKLQSIQEKLIMIARGWVKYSLNLFNASITKIVEHLSHDLSPNDAQERVWLSSFQCNIDVIKESVEENSNPTDHDESSNKLSDNADNDDRRLLFKLNTDTNCQVSTALIENTSEARALFNFSYNYLTKIRLFYTLEDHAMDYVNAILDLSELYRCLAFYEEDIDSQYSVQKLRADAIETLSTILRQVRPECYIAVSIELLQELAEIQLELLGLNFRRIYAARDAEDINQDRKIQTIKYLHNKIQQFKNNYKDTLSTS
ncbi:KIF-binding protein-like [Microplitis demolitor]|uniref:KIF-binding protein-like n=1 Tax=Microplitis demolitor TaxID=69319 RepID=UPI0004CDA64C|nr:KIF-binding protein-like [Microplitis demolitor]